jgi:catecholate siderophore receptor
MIDYDRSIDRGIPSIDGKPVDALNDIVFGDEDLNKSEFESLAFRALLQHSFSDTLKGVFSASYTDYDKLYQNFYAKNYDDLDTIQFDGYVDTTKRQNLVLSGNLVAEFEQGDMNHTVLYGAEYLDSSSENDRHTPIFPTGSNFSIAGRNNAGGFNAGGLAVPFTTGSQNSKDDSTSDVSVFSLYAQDEIELSDNLTVLLGVRYDKYEIDSVNVKDNNKKSDHSESEITPRMGLIYKPQENISYYASYSQTFLPASGDQFATVGKGADFDPNEYTNLEAGVKLNLAGGFNVTAAVFQVDADVVEENNNDVYQRFDNEIEGFELQVMRKVSDQWTVSAGYTKLDGDDTNTGNRIAELPKSSLSIWNNFQLSDKLGLGLGAIYQGESSPKGGPKYGTVPSFTRVDAAAYYQLSDNLRLQLNIENLLDEEYYPHAYDDHQFTVGAPLNATVSIKGTF